MFPPLNGNLKWVLALILAVVGTLASTEWRRIDRQGRENQVCGMENKLALAAIQPELRQIQQTLDEIKQALKEKD